MNHRWGCGCAECAGRAAKQLMEAQAVRYHNRQVFAGRQRPEPVGWVARPPEAFDMHYRFDWQGRPADAT